MPRTCTICYNEAEYAGKIKAKTVNVVLDKARKDGETTNKYT